LFSLHLYVLVWEAEWMHRISSPSFP